MQDLPWSCHINTLVKKAQQHLYHLRRLRDFKLPSQVLKTFYTCTIESVLTGSITSWFGNSIMQDRRALQRVVQSAKLTIHTEIPDLQDIYSTRCRTRARKIVKDLSHPNNGLFSLLRLGKRFRSLKANTDRMRRSFFPQAIRSLDLFLHLHHSSLSLQDDTLTLNLHSKVPLYTTLYCTWTL
ncbi:gastrula zinc finger protein XlCGF28.1-like [Silurus meridionalis]|nr:gastrula zinc finger protein XlCGF28.1-like [Silurus meridionalis]